MAKGYKVKLGFELYFAFCTQIFWFRLNFAESKTLVSIFKTQVTESSRQGEFHPKPLTGRVEYWRTHSMSHVSSTRHVKRSMRFSRTTLSYSLHLKAYGNRGLKDTFKLVQLYSHCINLTAYTAKSYSIASSQTLFASLRAS